MKKQTLLLIIITALSMTACTNKTEAQSGKQQKILVTYFSATGTTQALAEQIAAATGGELYAIEPQVAYTAADLDWTDKQSRTSVEMSDPLTRPALKTTKDNISEYDVIYIGYPIWWNVAPHIINTFIESHELTGKTIIPFATSGGSSIEPSVEALRTTYPTLNIEDGKLLNGATEKTVSEWTNR